MYSRRRGTPPKNVITHTAAVLARPGFVAAVPGDARRPGDILGSPVQGMYSRP
jgi:hypothetical protein